MSADDQEQLSIPAHTIRVVHDDSERTRLLKEVLRSSVELQETEAQGKPRQPRRVALSVAPPPRARRDRSKKRGARTLDLRELSECQEGDALCVEMAGVVAFDGAEEVSPLLEQCGQRISRLCARLQASEKELRAAEARVPATASAGGGAAGGGGGGQEIRLMHRSDEGPGAARARGERVVYDFVAKHAHFARLEELKDTVDRSEGFEGLREVIPRRFQHHPNLVLLNDMLLREPDKFREAIWSAPAPPKPAHQPAKTRLQQRTSANLQVSTDLDLAAGLRRMRKDRSAPTLLMH